MEPRISSRKPINKGKLSWQAALSRCRRYTSNPRPFQQAHLTDAFQTICIRVYLDRVKSIQFVVYIYTFLPAIFCDFFFQIHPIYLSLPLQDDDVPCIPHCAVNNCHFSRKSLLGILGLLARRRKRHPGEFRFFLVPNRIKTVEVTKYEPR